MNTYKITLAYDGTRFRGWQRQQNTKDTVQGIVEEQLTILLGRDIKINGSGRTDSGVHASGQTASFSIRSEIDPGELKIRMNERLPEDIRISDIEKVREHFHARKSAVAKCYEYHIDTRQKPDVFTRKYCFHYPHELNIRDMRTAVLYLKGTHDFSAFTDLKDSDDTVRTIYDIKIEQKEDKITFRFLGSGFLYHMVRILTGTLLNVGSGKISADQIPAILEERDRSWAGFPAPAKGLFLVKVYYDMEEAVLKN